ncbi:MAG: hypothetical protein B6I38_01280 [Anaerolineaceae bacterium 4572_5.1]|nr:MAG: hypothetical protein B6I38_01280 [Anaerolineaceae bacterium 4572_5.1]
MVAVGWGVSVGGSSVGVRVGVLEAVTVGTVVLVGSGVGVQVGGRTCLGVGVGVAERIRLGIVGGGKRLNPL